MNRGFFSRPLEYAVAIALLAVALISTIAVVPSFSRDANAQSLPAETTPASQAPPAAGPDPATGQIGDTVAAADLVPATPTVPVAPPDVAGVDVLPDSGGAMTTNLGGSDVAVASVGGSYEVDGPKRRTNRAPGSRRP